MLTCQSLIYIEGNDQTMLLELWHPGKGAKMDHIIQLNQGEVGTHASYKTTGTCENCNNRGTKMIFWWSYDY